MIDERTRAALDRLTDNEKTCLRGRLAQRTAKEMALELGISPHAVEKRLKMARTKLGLSSSLAAARLLEASEAYQRTGPQASALVTNSADRQVSGDPAIRAAAWRRIGPYLTGAVAMSLAIIAFLAVAPLNAPSSHVAPPPKGSAAPLPKERYLVQLLMRQGDMPIGSPRLVAIPGRPVRAMASNADGSRYDVSLTVAAKQGPAYLVRLDISGSLPDGRSIHATPALLVNAGEPSGLSLGSADAPLNLTLVVTPRGAEARSARTGANDLR
jgi:DNA-binding CsgD family transcriptional regulator